MKLRLLLALLGCLAAVATSAKTVVFLGGANDSDLFAEAFAELKLPDEVKLEHYCVTLDSPEKIAARARAADVVVINALVIELRELAAGGGIDFARTKLYALSSRRLPKELPALEPPELRAYRENRRPVNFRNMAYWIINREFDASVKFEPPQTLPEVGATHPEAGKIFPSIAAYREWAEANHRWFPDSGVVAFAVHAASINAAELALFRHLTDEFARQRLNVVVVYGDEVRLIRELLLDADGKANVDAVLALSFKFKSGLGEPLRQAMAELDVPVFNALRLYRQTTPEWRSSVRGMNDFAVAFGFIAPEISGMIEPSLLFGNRVVKDGKGREVQEGEPFFDNIRITVERLQKWIGLRRKPNADKRVAIFIYNGSGGKQNIGASYLNVPRSLTRIAGTLAGAGYRTGGLETLDEAAMTAALLKSARNVGSWAPGELDALIAGNGVTRVPRATYIGWFNILPEALRREVIAEWGSPETAKTMTSGNDFIIPMLRGGNLVILPEPMRGWLDDSHKLVHSATLAPPHQYLAVYLWLRHEFGADAMIHLGRHGSSEWLPGKQLGLSAACAPLAVRGDIPEIYPYIADGIGEGIIAKRRAAAVIIDHLSPFLKVPAADQVLTGLRERLTACQTADPATLASRRAGLFRYAAENGLAARLGLAVDSPELVDKLEDYAENRQRPAPFGLHTFGDSPSGGEVAVMLALIPAKDRDAARPRLENAGRDELDALLRALAGRFIAPGPSGDPVRNPASLPVGRNFYSFDPAKIPTPEAMEQGQRLAEELLAAEKLKKGALPHKVALVLWAGETTRTDGVNEAMALALMGMRLQYDAGGRVTGLLPVPGAQLGRPRVDILITASGAYRDQFADLLRLLDRAQRQAATLNDAENFLRENSEAAEAKLKSEGHSAAEAAEFANRRIFFPAPGTYGTRVNQLAGSSGLWQSDDEIAAVYMRNMGSSLNAKGEIDAAPAALAAAAARTDTLFHSRSSNVYGVTDIDDMYQYFGGLSLAVRKNAGRAPGEYIVDQRDRGKLKVSSFKSFLGAELDARLYNREWIEAMTKENYSGGKTLARMTDNLWGWQAVTPDNLSPADWSNLYDIYVNDRYHLNLKEFFAADNAWAYQSMTGRMLEAVRKEYWQPDTATRQSLAATYARSVISRGMACCDHTCNNPLLNQMVVNIISMPGVLSPELVMKFQVAVERAAAKTLDQQVKERRELQRELAAGFGKNKPAPAVAQPARTAAARAAAPNRGEGETVKGFKMKADRANAQETSLSSSGLKWTILLAVFALLALFALGLRHGDRG